jgi:hypothetical protein
MRAYDLQRVVPGLPPGTLRAILLGIRLMVDDLRDLL